MSCTSEYAFACVTLVKVNWCVGKMAEAEVEAGKNTLAGGVLRAADERGVGAVRVGAPDAVDECHVALAERDGRVPEEVVEHEQLRDRLQLRRALHLPQTVHGLHEARARRRRARVRHELIEELVQAAALERRLRVRQLRRHPLVQEDLCETRATRLHSCIHHYTRTVRDRKHLFYRVFS